MNENLPGQSSALLNAVSALRSLDRMTDRATFNQKHWTIEQITVGDRTIRITHHPSGMVAHGRDEDEAWMAMAVRLGERGGHTPHVTGDLDLDIEAKRIVFAIGANPFPEYIGKRTTDIADLLRRVWNARGAADLAAMADDNDIDEDDMVRDFQQRVSRAIKGLDR